MRKLVTIRIDPKIWRKAREMGLNISKTCENCLKQGIQRLQEPEQATQLNGGYIDARSASQQQRMAGGTGFEPATPSLGGSCPVHARLPAHCFLLVFCWEKLKLGFSFSLQFCVAFCVARLGFCVAVSVAFSSSIVPFLLNSSTNSLFR